jgi:hypothetical protein
MSKQRFPNRGRSAIALTIVTSSPPIIVGLSPASPSTITMPSSSSPSTTSSATTFTGVVFLPLKLLLSFGVLSEYPLLFGNFLRITLYPNGRLRQIGWPAGVCFLAGLAVGTEASQVEFTECLPNVLFRAIRAERAEAFFVVWTWGKFLGRVNV